MQITAHRGLSSLAPENTLAAFKKAIEFGCTWIELDVQLTQDEVVVVFHDKNLERCTNGNGALAQTPYQTVSQLDAGAWFSPEFKGESIPTLAQTLSLAKCHGVKLNIEIKIYPETDIDRLCQKIVDVIDAENINSTEILFSSFYSKALLCLQTLMPDVARGFLCQHIPEDISEILSEMDAYSLHCDYRYLDKTQMQTIKSLGYRIFCYTPNDPQLIREHWQWGLDMAITDVPQDFA
ncbi:MAG: glycerophosphoryl diester phosphodiesterase [Vibrio sp.]